MIIVFIFHCILSFLSLIRFQQFSLCIFLSSSHSHPFSFLSLLLSCFFPLFYDHYITSITFVFSFASFSISFFYFFFIFRVIFVLQLLRLSPPSRFTSSSCFVSQFHFANFFFYFYFLFLVRPCFSFFYVIYFFLQFIFSCCPFSFLSSFLLSHLFCIFFFL